jgi:hypothetical protein
VNLKGIQLTWLGHATFRIETPEGKTLYIDPWTAGNPMCPESEKHVKKADVLLCTHGHGDHIGDAVDVGKRLNPIAVGIFELCLWLQKKGVKQVSPMNKGGTQTVASVKVTMVHAVHSCGIQDGDQIIYGGEACGYVLEFSNGASSTMRATPTSSAIWRSFATSTRRRLPCCPSATTSPCRHVKLPTPVNYCNQKRSSPCTLAHFPCLRERPASYRSWCRTSECWN